jgi:hypothetical protein
MAPAKRKCEDRQRNGKERDGNVVRKEGRNSVEMREVSAKRKEAYVPVLAAAAVTCMGEGRSGWS